MLSVVERFKNVPWLCWDLINEPSFSNPDRLWKGNTPNGDPVELAAWRKWLARELRQLGRTGICLGRHTRTVTEF